MKSRLIAVPILLCALLVPIAPQMPLTAIAASEVNSAPQRQGSKPSADRPALFIANVGQLDQGVRFQVRGQNSTLFLTDDALWLTVVDPQSLATAPQHRTGLPSQSLSIAQPQRGMAAPAVRGVNLKLSFVGANTHARLEPFERSNTHVSFFRGDQASWQADLPVWAGVRYHDLYPGIDLELSSAHGQLEQRLRARPGADLSAVRLRVDGAQSQTIVGDNLRLQTSAGQISLPLLQVDSNDTLPVALPLTAPTIEGTDVRAPFVRSARRSSTPIAQSALGIGYSTLFGGMFDDTVTDLAVGSDGTTYVTGNTFSPDFPTTPGAFDTGCGNDQERKCNYDQQFYYYDTFAAKLNAAGTGFAYAMFLGGRDADFGNSIAVDANGAAYITGETFSPDFPTTVGAYDRECGADGECSFDSDSGFFADGFVVKINPTGTDLAYATFLGDLNYDWGNAIAVDSAGSAYVTGVTYSPDFPTTSGAYDRECGTDAFCTYDSTDNTVRPDAFITKLNPTGTDLSYSTFIGGTLNDQGFDIAVDQSNEAYITGNTISDDLPATSGAYDPGCGTDDLCDYDGDSTVYFDAFITKINTDGSNLVYLTYLGGEAGDGGFSIALDQTKAAYVTGYTYSSKNFPTSAGAFDPSFNGIKDAFVAKLNPAGSALAYSTLLGGSESDDGRSIVVDSGSNAYIAGLTFSGNFPISPDGYDATFNGEDDAYITKLNPAGTELIYATFLGGNSIDEAYGIGLHGDDIYIAGVTSSADFPISTGATYTAGTCGSDGGSDHPCYDVFVMKLAPAVGPTPQNTRMFLPMAVRLTAIAPDPLCDEYEPNNNRVNSATPLNLGATLTARICQKEGLPSLDELYQDNYRVSTTHARPLQIRLTLPQSLVTHVALAVYDTGAPTNPIGGCYIDEVRTTPYTLNCRIPNVGAAESAYVVRIYSWRKVFDNTQTYTLVVTQP